ncbi:hypothetical protein AGMMS49938_01490 [Fibrobacterales bacterium]|nr:hypothetical protein AGMMS49938_01490 [Fibrobacterales bacterium]
MNFFDKKYQEPITTDKEFGVCDDENGKIAYTDRRDKSKWIATITNGKSFKLIFTAIDKGVMKDTEFTNKPRCEGMIISTTKEHIYFLELKVQKKGGAISIAKKQLKSTIEIFNKIHPEILLEYKSRKAFICNKKHPYFKKIENSEQKEFWELYKVRLDINTEIIFK